MRTLALSVVATFGCMDDTAGPAKPLLDSSVTTGSPMVEPPDDPDPPVLDPIVDQVVPLVGGGIAAGSEWIAAVDPDGDLVHLVRAADRKLQMVGFERGSAPAAVAWTSSNSVERAHVLLRGNGSVAVVEPYPGVTVRATLVHQAPICPMPRGLVWDDSRELMWVVCAGGELVGSTEDGTIVTTYQLDSDLRDIVLIEHGRAMVSRLRSAEVLIVDLDSGGVMARFTPRDQTEPSRAPFVPRMLRRLVPAADGVGAVALYQAHDEATVEEGANGTPHYYGGLDDCSGIVRTVISTVTGNLGFGEPTIVDAEQGFVVDLVDSDLGWPVLATTGGVAVWLEESDPVGDGETCVAPANMLTAPALPTGVVRHGNLVWVTTREPFSVGTGLDLDQSSSNDGPSVTGLSLFHDAPLGIACASCHADGGDDGHTWNFPEGPRRTPSLGGILVSETAPFHWDGTLDTFDHLFSDVGVGRMGLEPLIEEQSLALQEFLDRLARPPPAGPPADPAIVAEGAVLFGDAEVGCAECHSGWRYSNGESADVGTGGLFQVPSLIGVGVRLPLMHDGCAQTLRERFDDPTCGGTAHGNTAHLTTEQIDMLVVFLESL